MALWFFLCSTSMYQVLRNDLDALVVQCVMRFLLFGFDVERHSNGHAVPSQIFPDMNNGFINSVAKAVQTQELHSTST